MPEYIKVGETPETELYATRGEKYGSSPYSITYHSVKSAESRARFAMECIIKWGMVAAEADGEDSAGRQKLRTLTPEEVARKACQTADLAFAEFERRGWMVKVPGFDKIESLLRDKENSN